MIRLEGIDTIEPSFGLPAKWITEDVKEDAEILGYTVVDPPSVVSTHLTEVIRANAQIYWPSGNETTRRSCEGNIPDSCRRTDTYTIIDWGNSKSIGQIVKRACFGSQFTNHF